MQRTLEWIADTDSGLVPGHIKMIDQTRLPLELAHLETADLEEVWEAIRVLRVRGAPAIGVAAAMGLAASLQHLQTDDQEERLVALEKNASYLASSRPTAVNLFWALDRMKSCARDHIEQPCAEWLECLAREAVQIGEEDAAMCRAIGEHGVTLIENGQTVLTHCNAGSLATAQYGTALSPVYVAKEKGMDVKVYADETRPLLQGARLTAWECAQAGIDVTLICDNTAAQVMKEGRIDLVMVGSDRIAGNGDAANKIGTYGVAVLAKAHNIPFYVLAPSSTFDLSLESGDDIPIEQRAAEEVTEGFGRRTAPEGVQVYSPAFDVTPTDLITAIICERGIIYPPFKEGIASLLNDG